jgi:ribosomal protein S2
LFSKFGKKMWSWNKKMKYFIYAGKKILKKHIFEIWNENFCLKFEKNDPITRGKWKKN